LLRQRVASDLFFSLPPLRGRVGVGGKHMPNERARHLRKNMTDTERFVWHRLRKRQLAHFKFRRQMPLGPFIIDFISLERRVILELDGGQHAELAEADQKRTEWLKEQGFRVLRFWNHEVWKDWDAIEQVLWEALEAGPPPQPSPARGEGEEMRRPSQRYWVTPEAEGAADAHI